TPASLLAEQSENFRLSDRRNKGGCAREMNPVLTRFGVLMCGTIALAVQSQPALDVSSRKQVFIDHRFIAQSSRVELTANQPKLAGPALEPGPSGSWDDGKVTWGQVAEDGGIFRMWAGGFAAKSLKGDWQEL